MLNNSLRHLFRTAGNSIFPRTGGRSFSLLFAGGSLERQVTQIRSSKMKADDVHVFFHPLPREGGCDHICIYIYKYTCLVFFMASVVGLRFFRWWICRARVLETQPAFRVRGSPLAFNVVFLCVYLLYTYIHACMHTYIRTYVRTYVRTYIYIYICIYIYLSTST